MVVEKIISFLINHLPLAILLYFLIEFFLSDFLIHFTISFTFLSHEHLDSLAQTDFISSLSPIFYPLLIYHATKPQLDHSVFLLLKSHYEPINSLNSRY